MPSYAAAALPLWAGVRSLVTPAELLRETFLERPSSIPRQSCRPGVSQPIDQGVTRRGRPPCTSSGSMAG